MQSTQQANTNTLLILDPDEAQCHSLSLLLGAYGYPCIQLHSVRELRQFLFDPQRVYCLLVDVGIHLDGHSELHTFIREHPQYPTIAMSCGSNVNLAVAYTRMGTISFLQKPLQIDNLLQAVRDGIKLSTQIMSYRQQRAVFESRIQKLSPRENEVLQLVIDGKSSSQIARELNLSVKTVSLHRTNLMNKLQVDGVVQLVRMITPGPLPKPAGTWQRMV